jgi:hypothetical protein
MGQSFSIHHHSCNYCYGEGDLPDLYIAARQRNLHDLLSTSPPCNPTHPPESHCTPLYVSVNYHSSLCAPAYTWDLLYIPATSWILAVLQGQPLHEGQPILEHKWKCPHNFPWLWNPHVYVCAQCLNTPREGWSL